MKKKRGHISSNCSLTEQKTIESRARSMNMTTSSYVKMKSLEPNVPKVAKYRNMVRDLVILTHSLYFYGEGADDEAITQARKGVNQLWRTI